MNKYLYLLLCALWLWIVAAYACLGAFWPAILHYNGIAVAWNENNVGLVYGCGWIPLIAAAFYLIFSGVELVRWSESAEEREARLLNARAIKKRIEAAETHLQFARHACEDFIEWRNHLALDLGQLVEALGGDKDNPTPFFNTLVDEWAEQQQFRKHALVAREQLETRIGNCERELGIVEDAEFRIQNSELKPAPYGSAPVRDNKAEPGSMASAFWPTGCPANDSACDDQRAQSGSRVRCRVQLGACLQAFSGEVVGRGGHYWLVTSDEAPGVALRERNAGVVANLLWVKPSEIVEVLA